MAIAFALVLLVLFNVSHCQQYSKSVDLMNAVLTGYNSRQRPLHDQKNTINVYVSLTVASIRDLDEMEGNFAVVGILGLQWQDEVINWTPASYGGASKIDLKLSDIWYPKIVLANPFTKIKELGEDWMTLSVSYEGDIQFQPVSIFEAVCNVDVKYYPFDTQTCSLIFSELAYTGMELALIPINKVGLSSSLQSGQWELVSSDITRVNGSSAVADRIEFTFTMKRKSKFVIVNIIMPIIVMAILNMLVFILPADSGERLSFSVTMLLALAVYMTIVSETLPKSSDPMSILSFYLMGTLLVSSTITVLTILNLNIYHRQTDVHQRYKSFTRFVLARNCGRKGKDTPIQVKVAFAEDEKADRESPSNDDTDDVSWHDVSSAVDRLCLWLFVVVNITMNIVFLVILMSGSES